VHLNPAALFEAAPRGIDALPRAPDLMGQFLLGQCEPEDAVVASGLAEQDLGDAARHVQEDEVGGRFGATGEGRRQGISKGLRRGWHARAEVPDRFARDEEQAAFLKRLGVRGPPSATLSSPSVPPRPMIVRISSPLARARVWAVQRLYGRHRDVLVVYGKEKVYGSIP
jgi:hypothetical protein